MWAGAEKRARPAGRSSATNLLRNSCPKGGRVLDPFGGSGTTLIAAEQEGRSAALLELDPKYVDVIVKRFELFSGQKAERLEP